MMACPKENTWELFSMGLLDVAECEGLCAHLEQCDVCRRQADRANQLSIRLQSAYEPHVRLHEIARRELLGTLSDRKTSRVRRMWVRWLRHGEKFRIAAMLVLVLGGVWFMVPSARFGMNGRQVESEWGKVQWVLGWTNRSLQQVEDAAVQSVLADPLSETMQRLPIRWHDDP